jgi:glycine cleavage system H protein
LADYEIPDDLSFTNEDEWARREGNNVVVGVTDYAQQQLGDIVYVELPSVGSVLSRGDPFGVIESVKAVSDLYAPVSGEVVDVNTDLAEHPEAVNEDCYGDGWMIAIAITSEDEFDSLMDAAGYRQHVDDRSD